MDTKVLDGKAVAAHRQALLQNQVSDFKQKYGRSPRLDVILAGDDPASRVYVNSKYKTCQKLGLDSMIHVLPQGVSQDELLAKLESLKFDRAVDGILVQLPVPRQIDAEAVIAAIPIEKDADGLSLGAMGALVRGVGQIRPCTPLGVIRILEHYEIPLAGRNAVVVGRSLIVGKPMALLLLEKNCTVTIAHSKSKDLTALTRGAEIVVVAAGLPRFLGREDFAKGAVVVDVGIHRRPEGLCGDVRFEELVGHVSAATPVPGGVGPMTITTLLENTLLLAQGREGA